MDALSSDAFVRIVALVGAIIIVAALLSGLVDRTGLPQVVVFIGLGAVLGPSGLGLLNVGLDSAMQPDHVVERAQELSLPRDAWIIPYCT